MKMNLILKNLNCFNSKRFFSNKLKEKFQNDSKKQVNSLKFFGLIGIGILLSSSFYSVYQLQKNKQK